MAPRLVPLTEEEVQRLMAQIRRIVRLSRFHRRVYLGFMAVWIASIPLYFCLKAIFGWKDYLSYITPILLGFNFLITLVGLWVRGGRVSYEMKKLAAFVEVRRVGELADMLAISETGARKLAERALLALLPQLKTSDARLLNTRQRENLHSILIDPSNVVEAALKMDLNRRRRARTQQAYIEKSRPLALALIQAYQQVGDERDLPVVQRLAEGNGVLAKDAEIRAAAQNCLPFLQANAERNRTSQMLLRAAPPPSMTSAELLRPVAALSPNDPQQLLRATDQPL
ncbi:MAG TPA: hypothetical protein VKU00_31455 [Chthonomonadaceae bacterium]|nr:hypothetical protein [Chthonomonadaceae bacterium]